MGCGRGGCSTGISAETKGRGRSLEGAACAPPWFDPPRSPSPAPSPPDVARGMESPVLPSLASAVVGGKAPDTSRSEAAISPAAAAPPTALLGEVDVRPPCDLDLGPRGSRLGLACTLELEPSRALESQALRLFGIRSSFCSRAAAIDLEFGGEGGEAGKG